MIADLLEKSIRKFNTKISNSKKVQAIYKKAAEGIATYKDAKEFASITGKSLADVLVDALTEARNITEEDALELIPGLLKANHECVIPVVNAAQKKVCKEASVGLKPVDIYFDTQRAKGLSTHIRELVSNDKYEVKDFAGNIEVLTDNFSLSTIDNAVKYNAKAHYNAGLDAIVIREYDGVGVHNRKDQCEWCKARAGVWSYADAIAHGVFERHSGCGCTITYKTQKGKKRQTDWTTNTWEDIPPKTIEYRKSFMGVSLGQNKGERVVPKSIGARVFKNSIIDFETMMEYNIGGNGRISNVETFAGMGSKNRYRNAYKYSDRYGGLPEEWKHMKGIAFIENEYESGYAEIHWSEHEIYGSYDPFVKKWL